MKMLAFVDVHGDLLAVKKLLEKAKKEKVDLLVCAGDMTFFGHSIEQLIKKFGTEIPLLIIPGNHETVEEIKIMSKHFKFVKDLHLGSILIGNCLFIGCGGSFFTSRHTPFEQNEKKFEASISKLKVQNKNHKVVLVVHEPPFNTSLDVIGKFHLGSESIRKFIEKYQPNLCICGHFHETFGKTDSIGKTTIINPGPKGMVIEI